MKFETISDNDLLNNANNREVGFAEASLARLGQTFEIDNTMGTVVNEAKVAWESLKELSAGYDPNQPTLEDTINARARGEEATFQPQELEKISQEDFAKEGFGEFGAKWNEGMTRARAGVEKETSERLKRYQMIGEQADLNPVYGFGLDIVANVVDPINFVGLGPSSKIAGVGKKILASGAAAGMENLAVSAINRPYWEERGIESTWVDYTMDGLMGFGLGGLMGGAQHLIQTRKLRSKVKPETKMTVAKIQAQTIEQIRNNDKVDWSNIPDADKAIGEIFNLPEKEAALSFRQNAKRISESLGISEEDALAQQLPALLHMRDFRAKQTGEDFNELVTSFVIENVKSKNKKAVGIEFDLKAENALRVESKLLDDEVSQMLTEVQSGVKGERSGKMMDVGDGYEFINISTKSTYPKWYRDIGVKSKEHFEKVVNSRKGPIWKRIKEIAQDRLENGGADGEGIPFEPSNEWRKLKGMEPVLLNQDSAPNRVTGEVIEFDGLEGVIKLADGERVYFDAESIRKGRSLPGVGEKVEVSLEEGAEFPMAETLYQDARGKIDFTEDGESIITLYKGADNTTVLHEQGHFFLNSFEEVVNSGKANKQTIADWKTTQNWLNKQDYKASKADIDSMVKKLKEKDFPLKGHELRKFARDKVEEINRHEFFARGFEQYMRDGNAPFAGVARVFEKFRDWFRGIYKSRESLNADITPEMRDVYTRLMGGEKTLSLKGELPTPKARLTPEERVLSDDFDSFIESYNQGALDEFDTKAVEDVLQFENTVTKAQDIYKKIGELTSLYQKPLDMADQIAGEFEIPKSEAREMVDGVLGLVVEDGPERSRQIATILSTLSEGLDRQKALEKRNAAFSLRARQNIKGFVDKIIKENYQDKGKWKTFVESNGTPERAILATLEGDSRMRGVQGAGQAVYADYQGLSQYWTQNLMSEMEKVDPNIEKLFSKDPTLNENVVREMWEIRSDGSGNPGITGDPRAKKIAELFSKMSEETRTRLNDAGADIGKLDGWVPRRHDYEKMVLAGRDGWIADIRSKLDIERSFPWVKNEDELLEALGETYDNLVTGIHEINDLPGLNDAVVPSPANIAKRMGKTRKLHFTDSGSELEYLKKYAGAYNIAETMFSHLDRSARTASLMERLGPNPDNTIISVIDQVKEGLRKGEYGIPQDKVQELVKQLPNRQQLAARETNIGRAMSVVTGENQLVENVTMANVSGAIRSINTLSKLMAATLSQFSDALSVANEMRIIKDQGYAGAWKDTLKAYFKKMSPEQKTNVLDKLGIMSDGFNLASFNRFDAADNLNSKFARAMDKGFKMSGMTQLTNKIKSGFGLALSKEFGENLDKSFDDLAPGVREVLSQYGSIDASKWDIIRSSQGIDVEGQRFLTPDSIRKLEDEAFDSLLPEELRVTSLFEGADSKLEAKRATEIKRVKRELEQSLRTVFVEETRNAVLEPDARVMRTTTGGYKRGTTAGEAWRLMNQFKSFTYAYTQRTLGGKRMMKKEGDYGGIVHHALMGGLLGYMSMVAKDLSKGKEPRDPTSSATWAAAMAQSGGAGIIGDLAFNDANRFGGGILATLGGPTLGTAEDLYKLTVGNMHKAVAGEKTDFLSDSVNFIQRNNPIPHANLWYTRTAMNYLFWYQLREALNPGSIRRMERRVKKDNNQEYLLSPSSLVR